MFAYRQGMLDSLCSIYCSINAVRLSISGIACFSARSCFEEILSDLSKQRKLLFVHKFGSSSKAITRYLDVLQAKLAQDVKISYSKPFINVTRKSTIIKKLSILSQKPNTAIIIGISGKYYHWSLIDKVTENRIYLNDSLYLKYLNINKIPNLYQLNTNEIFVIKAKVCK